MRPTEPVASLLWTQLPAHNKRQNLTRSAKHSPCPPLRVILLPSVVMAGLSLPARARAYTPTHRHPFRTSELDMLVAKMECFGVVHQPLFLLFLQNNIGNIDTDVFSNSFVTRARGKHFGGAVLPPRCRRQTVRGPTQMQTAGSGSGRPRLRTPKRVLMLVARRHRAR